MTYATLAAFSGIVVPVILAAVIGALCVPLIERLERLHVPRRFGAVALIAALLGVLVGAVAVVIRGVIDEATEIRIVITAGLGEINDAAWTGTLLDDPHATVSAAAGQAQSLLTGAASWATTVFSSAVAFGIGTFLALFILYYILVDWVEVRGWLSRHLGVAEDLGAAIIDDATTIVGRGFGAMTVTSLVTAAVVGAAMLVLGLPLALAVTVVTFVTSYVPYLGAFIAGVFAFLIALGAGGPSDAAIILVVVLVAQNVLQTIVGNQLTSSRLSLRPLPSLISSVCGVAVAGVLGAIVSGPAAALGIAVSRRLRQPELVPGVEPDGSFGPKPDAPMTHRRP